MPSSLPKTVRRFGLVIAAALAVGVEAPKSMAQAQAPRVVSAVATAPDGVPIAYETHGDARGDGTPALVFVHGWSCDRTYWAGQLAPFARDFHVVAVDLAGHGESGLGRGDWTMAAFGGDVAAVVEQLGLRRVILIGHSMGGDVIAEAARRLPGRVAGLVWVDTYRALGAGRSPEQVQAFTARLRASFVDSTRALVRGMFVPTSDRSLVERVAADMAAAPPAVALSALEHAFAYSREMPRTLQALRVPVVAINPDDGPTDAASMAPYGVTVVLMPGVGHFLQLEDPARFNRLLRTAVDKFAR
jgi:pimeloyl-ACP methyl ester carboxylesterase